MFKPILSIVVTSSLVSLSAIVPAANSAQAAEAIATNGQNSSEFICRGVIQNRIDYTAIYASPQAGFTSISFRPRTSDRTLSATLRYAGRDGLRRQIWRGASGPAAQAEITLLRLSTRPTPQRGEQISVSYDGQWGRATCQPSR